PTLSCLLFTMSEIAHASGLVRTRDMRNDVCGDDVWSVPVERCRHSGSPSRSWLQPAKAGGARRDRTDDLMLAKHALSQLSYGPVAEDECLTGLPSRSSRQPARLRPLGSGAAALFACASEGWWAWEDLNFRPHAYQARAL